MNASISVRQAKQIILPEARPRAAVSMSAVLAVLFATAFAAPLAFGAVQQWAWAGLILAAAAAILIWSAACIRSREIVAAWTPLYVPMLLLMGLGLWQYMTGRTEDAIGTREALLKAIAYFVILAGTCTASSTVSAKFWATLGWAITFYTFTISLFAIIQFFSSPQRIFWTVIPTFGGAIFGPYVNHNHYAGLMEMLIPLTGGFFLSRRSSPSEQAVAFVVVLAVVSVLISGSRGGAAAILAEAVIGAIVALGHQRSASVWLKFGVVAITIALLVAWLVPESVAQRYQFTVRRPDVSLADRAAIARDGVQMLKARPLAGFGLGSFATSYPRYQSIVTDLLIDHAHDDYVEALAETGLLGGALIAVALSIFGAAAWRNFLTKPVDAALWLRFGATLGCCGMLIHSAFDFNLHIPANAVWMALCVGLAVGPTTVAASKSYRIHRV